MSPHAGASHASIGYPWLTVFYPTPVRQQEEAPTAAPKPEKKNYDVLSRQHWAALGPLAAYMTSAKPGGEKKCGGSATIVQPSNSFSNKL